jgi:hypothetical protein
MKYVIALKKTCKNWDPDWDGTICYIHRTIAIRRLPSSPLLLLPASQLNRTLPRRRRLALPRRARPLPRRTKKAPQGRNPSNVLLSLFPTPVPFPSHDEQPKQRRGPSGGWRRRSAPGSPSHGQGGGGGRRSRRSVDSGRGGPRNPRRRGPPLPRGLRHRRW